MWIAILDAGPPAALCSHTSLELAGFKSSHGGEADTSARSARCEGNTDSRGSSFTNRDGSVKPAGSQTIAGLPRTEHPRSVIDAAAWQPWPRFACLMLAAAVQQRLCTPAELEHAMSYVGRVRHKAYLRVASGRHCAVARTHSVRLDVAAICRRFGLLHRRTGK